MTEPAAPAGEDVLRTEALGRRFGGLEAVANVSLRVPAGEVLGVIGPNGAGKSTLVNLVTGHLRPTAGTVYVDGRDVTGARPWVIARARVARTFQMVRPFRGMTVRENVAVGVLYGPGRIHAMAGALAAADQTLERVGLGGMGHRQPSELSLAGAHRLEFARALALNPRLLLLDEVMAGLRAGEIDQSLALIDELKRSGMAIVVIEHVMKAILAVSDRLLMLHHGRVLTIGRPREVLSDERVVEAYLGQRYARRQEK